MTTQRAPRGWKKRVKRVLLNVISLGRVCTSVLEAEDAVSSDPAVRGSAEGEAQQREIRLFREGEHNARLPHSAFRGQTPDEMYFGNGDHIPDDLEAARVIARQSRFKANRTTTCYACELFPTKVE